MKKILALLTVVSASLSLSAETFEGELNYRNFENHSKAVRTITKGMQYNGPRDIQVIVKGNVTLMRDKSMHIDYIYNPDANYVIVYGDIAKEGLKYPYETYVKYYGNSLGPGDSPYPSQHKQYGVMETGHEMKVGEWNCKSYEGTVTITVDGISTPTVNNVSVWYVPELAMPESYKAAYYGLNLPGAVGKWTHSVSSKVPMIGTMSSYVSGELKSVIRRPVQDDELLPPSDVVIKETDKPAKMYGFLSKVMKAVKKAGLYPTQADKDTEVTYKIDEEWDF